GHVGKFDVFQENSYGYNDASGRYVHNGWKDTLVTFAASPYNPELAAINTQFFSLFDNNSGATFGPGGPQFEPGPYTSLLEVQNGNALLNGQNPSSTYGLWSYVGAQGNSYNIFNDQQF